MTAILTRYFAEPTADGGTGMSDGTASSVYAACSTMIYMTAAGYSAPTGRCSTAASASPAATL